MTAELSSEERDEAWRVSVDDHLDELTTSVDTLKESAVEIGVVKRLTAGLFPAVIVGALSFVVTAYVAFDRLGRAQDDLDAHTHATAIQAHPDLVQQVAPVRETQERIAATLESMQREAARRDAEIQSRLDRMESRLDQAQRR